MIASSLGFSRVGHSIGTVSCAKAFCFNSVPTLIRSQWPVCQVKFSSQVARTNVKVQRVAALNSAEYRALKAESEVKVVDEEEDKDLCPVDCVKEFKTNAELFEILERAKKSNSLVVIDFYRTACGSCKYIEQGFIKLCKGAGDKEASVIFLKHNVVDEYDEQSEVAERLKIKNASTQ
eukprot:TRINITY_DN24143_c0_g1_i2.p1 TRINITY_DN24143_c0_g1~~TRINITY_DN24143_c0_g1_i2.p1  ORF type:complete len:178 (+),score=13.81 TRINITY_DN24143_c0_g1_i2:181-714(+)